MLAVNQLAGFGAMEQAVAAIGVTWNPSDKNADVTLSNGDYDATVGPSAHSGVRATLGRSTGAYYFEIFVVEASTGAFVFIGVADATTAGASLQYPGATANSIGSRGDFGAASGTITQDGTPPGAANADNDVLQCAVDLDNGHVWLGRNNTWFGGITPAVGSSSGRFGHFTPPLTLFPAGSVGEAAISRIRTLASDLTFTPPAGFTAWAGG